MVAMPEALFFRGQLPEAFLRDDVLDSDKACIVPVRIEDHALMQVVPQMDAEVMRLDLAAHVVGIHVEPIKPRTHRLKGKFGLHEARGEIEQAMLCGMTFSDIRHRACTSPDHYARRRREPDDNASRDRRELAPLIQQSTSRPHERLLLPGSHHFLAIVVPL
jgi:hypothetical protein